MPPSRRLVNPAEDAGEPPRTAGVPESFPRVRFFQHLRMFISQAEHLTEDFELSIGGAVRDALTLRVGYSSFFGTHVITLSLPQKRGLATGLLELKVVSWLGRRTNWQLRKSSNSPSHLLLQSFSPFRAYSQRGSSTCFCSIPINGGTDR